jgi:catechol 2,3-dioxygenase-like lactoylglutathione lyase family enzyme
MNRSAKRFDTGMGDVTELRLVLTVSDFDAAVALYRDALGLEEVEAWEGEAVDAHIAILGAGRATLELVNEPQAAAIDRIEVGRRVAGPVRIAFKVGDSGLTAERLVQAGAEQLAAAVTTPWNDRNVRVRVPDGMQLTLFSALE